MILQCTTLFATWNLIYYLLLFRYDLLKLCNNGPRSQLNDMRYGHVAIMTTCLANLELLREERPNAIYNCVGAAGFSLGEITALVFAGAFHFEEGK